MRSKYRKYTQEDDAHIMYCINDLGMHVDSVADSMGITAGMVNGRVRRLRQAGFSITFASRKGLKHKPRVNHVPQVQRTRFSFPGISIGIAIVLVTVFAMSFPFVDMVVS